jgi:hypothetical protein
MDSVPVLPTVGIPVMDSACGRLAAGQPVLRTDLLAELGPIDKKYDEIYDEWYMNSLKPKHVVYEERKANMKAVAKAAADKAAAAAAREASLAAVKAAVAAGKEAPMEAAMAAAKEAAMAAGEAAAKEAVKAFLKAEKAKAAVLKMLLR